MEAIIFETLKRIRYKHGPKEFGKVAQKLLGIALCRLCFEVKEHSVQDVDIAAVKNELKYWLEVKTTDKDEVIIGEKDISGLKQCKLLHGGETGYATLKVSLLSDWNIASSRNIESGAIRIGRFSTQRILPLENEVNKIFPSIVKELGNQILSASKGEAQFIADRLLKEEISKKQSLPLHT
jgi:Holliday junction resolvase